MNKPFFCLEVWGTDYDKIKDTCLLAEDLGYYGFYYGESLSNVDLDCWTVLSSLLSLTKKIKLGPVITYLIPLYRSIVLTAKQAITFQEISHGRLEFRTGAGASLQYASPWWNPYGIDYPENRIRVSMFDEGVQVLKLLLSNNNDECANNSSINFDGMFFKLSECNIIKPKIKIPITVAANKNKMMKIASCHADTWESSYLSAKQFSKLKSKFEEYLHEIENIDIKNTKKIRNSIELDVLIADNDEELEHKKKVFEIERESINCNNILSNGLVGKPDVIIKTIEEYIHAGVDQFFLAFQDPFDYKALNVFMNSIKDNYIN